MRNLTGIIFLMLATGLLMAQPTTTLQVTSGNSIVENQFEWAVNRALSLVVEGQVVAGYSAAMDLSQFCARDVSHMAEGAHMLGLDTENQEMMYAFAYGANRRVTQDFFWPRWHYKFDGSDLYDFGSCQWRCLPATFDVMQSCYRQYLWTGDTSWINDDEMFTFYSNTHDYTKFMLHQDMNSNGVADELIQLATYWEQSPDDLIEAGDAISFQYMALVSYSKILEARGDLTGAETFAARAATLKNHFENNWFSNEDNMYIRGFDEEGNYQTNWGRESSFLIPYSQITDQGPRTEKLLDFITQNIYTLGINIEATTYLAEIFYLHNRNSTGWHYLKGLMASQNTYPEVSYLIVNNTISGMMGIRPDAPQNKFYTLPKLSYEVPWIQVDHLPIGTSDLTIRHDGNSKTTVTNNSGVPMTWEAQFGGEFNTITVNGSIVSVSTKTEWGKLVSYTSTIISPGETKIIEAGNQADIGYVYLSDIEWLTNTNPANTRLDFNTMGNLLFMNGYKSYEKGLGVMPNTEITYDISGLGYKSFITDVGIDDEAGDQGSVIFEISVDDVIVFNSGLMQGSSKTRSMALNIENASTLKIKVTDGGNGNYKDFADFGEARLSKFLVPVVSLNYDFLSGGDGNGIFDPGETMEVHLTAENTGSASTGALTSTCTAIGANSNLVTINDPVVSIGELLPGNSTSYTHSISIDADAPVGAQFQLRFEVTDGDVSVFYDREFFITDMYLSDADYSYANFSFGSLVKDASINNNPITLNGVVYEKGLGVHASCEIRYDLGGSFVRFTSDVGVDDEVSQNGSVIFEVWADGIKVFESGLMEPDTPTESIDLNVTGVDELKLVVTDGGNGINSDHADWAGAKVSSLDYFEAAFSSNITHVQLGSAVSFSDQSTGNPTSWNWTFEGGMPETSTDQNPVITYNSPGIFDVTLEISDGSKSDVLVKPDFIHASSSPAPVADFTAIDNTIQTGGTVFFTDLSTNAVSWLWTFEGGIPATSSDQNPAVVYSQAGDYDVTLVVSDGICTDEIVKTEFVHVSIPGSGDLLLTFQSLNGGNGNNIFDPGETLNVFMQVQNNGSESTGNLSASCIAVGENSDLITVNNPVLSLAAVEPNGSAIYSHSITVDENATPCELFTLHWVITDNNETAQAGKKFFITGLYLSDTVYTYAHMDWGNVGKDVSIDGHVIELNETIFEKGLGTHANCELRYDLDGNFTRFISSIGVDDEVDGSPASVTFQVWADGMQLYNSPVMYHNTPTGSIDVDITGKNELKLIVTDGGDGINSDHADLANARITSAIGQTQTVLNLKAFLEGPFNGVNMNTSINSILPLSQPFTGTPWNYEGSETVSSVPGADIVDWVLIDLRDAPSANEAVPSTRVAMKAAFLRNDGQVVDLNGDPDLSFLHSPVINDLFVVLYSRNHLPVISAAYLTDEGSGHYSYDFSSGEAKVLGGSDGHKNLGNGIWGMFSGNSNGDYSIDDSDLNESWKTEAGTSDYILSDHNLDGQSDNKDKDTFWLPNRGKNSYVPQ